MGNELPETVTFDHTETQYLTYLLAGGVPLLGTSLLVLFLSADLAVLGARREVEPDKAVAVAVLGTAIALPLMWTVWPYTTNAGLGQSFAVVLGLMLASFRNTGPIQDQRQRAGGTRAHPPVSSCAEAGSPQRPAVARKARRRIFADECEPGNPSHGPSRRPLRRT